MNRVLYIEWLPQIMYNHHQTGRRHRDVCPRSAIRSTTPSIR